MNVTYLTDEPVRLGPLLFLRSIRRVLARPIPWLTTSALIVLLALPVGFAWHAFVHDVTANRYLPDGAASQSVDPAAAGAMEPFRWDDVVHSLTPSFRHDHAAGLADLQRSVSQIGSVLALVAILVGLFASGGWLQVILERAHGRSLTRFFLGGSRYFFRFFRLFLLVLLLLAGWRWLVYGRLWDEWVLGRWQGIPEAHWQDLGSLDSELTAKALGWLRDGGHAAGVALVLAWATYVRTRMALLDGTSAVKAGVLTVLAMVRHPIKTLGPLVSLLGLEVLLVSIALGKFMRWLDDGLVDRPSRGLVGAMALVGLLSLLVREVLRGARYHSAVKVSQAIVRRPARRPDPWRSIGGPGGPQYPVDEVEGEEYVAM